MKREWTVTLRGDGFVQSATGSTRTEARETAELDWYANDLPQIRTEETIAPDGTVFFRRFDLAVAD